MSIISLDACINYLLEGLLEDALGQQIHLLRKLPVHFELAPQKTIAKIERLQPDVMICCGMAERRSRPSVESSAKHCILVHVPVLHDENLKLIAEDFLSILEDTNTSV